MEYEVNMDKRLSFQDHAIVACGTLNMELNHLRDRVLLDATGFFDEMMQNNPEEILEFSDWMGIPMEPCPVTLDRLLGMLSDEVEPVGEFK